MFKTTFRRLNSVSAFQYRVSADRQQVNHALTYHRHKIVHFALQCVSPVLSRHDSNTLQAAGQAVSSRDGYISQNLDHWSNT
jgi:hypothetical protein